MKSSRILTVNDLTLIVQNYKTEKLSKQVLFQAFYGTNMATCVGKITIKERRAGTRVGSTLELNLCEIMEAMATLEEWKRMTTARSYVFADYPLQGNLPEFVADFISRYEKSYVAEHDLKGNLIYEDPVLK